MKKKIIILTITLLLILLMFLIPIPNHLKDGGTIEYKAILYKVSKVKRFNSDSIDGYERGLIVKILGNEIYNNVSYVPEEFDFEIKKIDIYNSIKYNKYYEYSGRVIYFKPYIEEFYIYNNNKITLSDYVSKTFQTLDDSIKKITGQMDSDATYRDGGTKLYKSKIRDISIVVCNKITGNKDIYVGDYSMNYESDMCERIIN